MILHLNIYDKVYIKIIFRNKYDICPVFERYSKFVTNTMLWIGYDRSISLTFVNRIKHNKLYYLSNDAAYNEMFYILDKRGLKLCFNGEMLLASIDLKIEEGFDTELLKEIVDSLVRFHLVSNGILPIHSCSIEMNSSGIIFPAWGGIGKTRLLFNLTDRGAKYISDEWSLIRGDSLLPLFASLNMLAYDLREYGDRVGLTKLEKIKLAIGNKIKTHKAKMILSYFNFVVLNKEYLAEEVFPEMEYESKVERIYLLQKSDCSEVVKEEISKDELLEKLTISFFHEHRTFLYYWNMYRYAFQPFINLIDNIDEMYRRKLKEIIVDKQCYRLTIPNEKVKQVNIIEML